MMEESEKYKRIVKVLRDSKPILDSTEEIEKEVIKVISKTHKTGFILSDVVDFLFGWIYIGWIRRSLITASVFLILVFVWQQGIILQQINYLSRQTLLINGERTSGQTGVLQKRMLLFKQSGRRFPSQTITISEKQMNQLLDSVNELQVKYKDLINLIEKDPELKNLLEKKLNEKEHEKIKL